MSGPNLCDRCGGVTEAKYEVLLSSGLKLLLCKHCLDKHRGKLDEQNAVIVPCTLAAPRVASTTRFAHRFFPPTGDVA
jgi:hypothetical protein